MVHCVTDAWPSNENRYTLRADDDTTIPVIGLGDKSVAGQLFNAQQFALYRMHLASPRRRSRRNRFGPAAGVLVQPELESDALATQRHFLTPRANHHQEIVLASAWLPLARASRTANVSRPSRSRYVSPSEGAADSTADDQWPAERSIHTRYDPYHASTRDTPH